MIVFYYSIFFIIAKIEKSISQLQSFGSVPTKEQIQLAGGTCPICHDSYQDPVVLSKWIF